MKRLSLVVALAALSGMAIGQPAHAAADLQITEMWGGGLPGGEVISDWFELTNFGPDPATSLDGNIYYGDNGTAGTGADPYVPLAGIDTIAPGESVIYLVSWEDDWATAADAIDDFEDMWGPPNGDLSGAQIGYAADGGGLGGGGDGVAVRTGPFVISSTLIDTESYTVDTQEESFVSLPDGTWVDNTFAQDGKWGAYTGNFNATDGDAGPPIGSPGKTIPEPTSMLLMILGVAGMGFARRQR